jgi:hypothetical protein
MLIRWPGFYDGGLGQKIVALGVAIATATGAYFGTTALLQSRELAELRLVRRTKSTEVSAG